MTHEQAVDMLRRAILRFLSQDQRATIKTRRILHDALRQTERKA